MPKFSDGNMVPVVESMRVKVVISDDPSFRPFQLRARTARRAKVLFTIVGKPLARASASLPDDCVLRNRHRCHRYHGRHWSQKYAYGDDRICATGFQSVNYAELAATLNVPSERGEDPGTLGPVLRRALGSGQAACVEVITQDLPGPDTYWWFVESGQGSP